MLYRIVHPAGGGGVAYSFHRRHFFSHSISIKEVLPVQIRFWKRGALGASHRGVEPRVRDDRGKQGLLLDVVNKNWCVDVEDIIAKMWTMGKKLCNTDLKERCKTNIWKAELVPCWLKS